MFLNFLTKDNETTQEIYKGLPSIWSFIERCNKMRETFHVASKIGHQTQNVNHLFVSLPSSECLIN